MSSGANELVVFILQVKRNDRGLISSAAPVVSVPPPPGEVWAWLADVTIVPPPPLVPLAEPGDAGPPITEFFNYKTINQLIT